MNVVSQTKAMQGARKGHRETGVKFPCKCGGNLSRVVNSRPSVIGEEGLPVIRRSRLCDQCGCRATTLEVVEAYMATMRREIIKDIAVQIFSGRIT